MMKNLSFRFWVSLVTFVLVFLILFLSRHELVHAWQLVQKVNVWILALMVPVALIGYLAAGEMIFSYLRQKDEAKGASPLALMRLSLELNFVNHALPSGGVSGLSYANWCLARYGVSSGRATMAQVVRYATGFAAIVFFLILAVLAVTIDGNVNRWIILMSSALIFMITLVTIVGVYLLRDIRRMRKFAAWVDQVVNGFGRRVLHRRKDLVRGKVILGFFDDLHDDFVVLRRDKKLLLKPFLWGLLFTTMEIALFWVAFKALGVSVNPAPLLIAYGIASFAGFIVMTPGGVGAYEAIVIWILTLSGISQGQAIAGTVLYRMAVLLTTVVFGYVFYQLTIMKHGRRKTDPATKRQ